MNTFERIAKKVQRIANEISSIDVTKSLKETLQDVLGIETEILKVVNGKIAQINIDNQLKNLYTSSGELISSVKSIESKIETVIENNLKKSKYDVELTNTIRDTLLRTIKYLYGFYKFHLNPKFNFHGITHRMINDRMNELKEAWKTMGVAIRNYEDYEQKKA
jgi:hypothetical protein